MILRNIPEEMDTKATQGWVEFYTLWRQLYSMMQSIKTTRAELQKEFGKITYLLDEYHEQLGGPLMYVKLPVTGNLSIFPYHDMLYLIDYIAESIALRHLTMIKFWFKVFDQTLLGYEIVIMTKNLIKFTRYGNHNEWFDCEFADGLWHLRPNLALNKKFGFETDISPDGFTSTEYTCDTCLKSVDVGKACIKCGSTVRYKGGCDE